MPFKTFRRLAALTAVAAGVSIAPAFADPSPEGVWLTQSQDAHVEIAPCASDAEKLCGTVVWLKDPLDDEGNPVTDALNPEPELQSRPVMGLEILSDFEKGRRGRWDDGTIYDPSEGKSYSSKMQVQDDGTLEVSGCILFLCQDQIWTPVAN